MEILSPYGKTSIGACWRPSQSPESQVVVVEHAPSHPLIAARVVHASPEIDCPPTFDREPCSLRDKHTPHHNHNFPRSSFAPRCLAVPRWRERGSCTHQHRPARHPSHGSHNLRMLQCRGYRITPRFVHDLGQSCDRPHTLRWTRKFGRITSGSSSQILATSSEDVLRLR